MSVAGIAKAAAGAKVRRGTTPTTRIFPRIKWMMVALALLALVTLVVVIPASQGPNAERYYSVGTKTTDAQ
jgi:hypothetical protein